MRPVYVISGGISRSSKFRPDKTLRAVVKAAYDAALEHLEIDRPGFPQAWVWLQSRLLAIALGCRSSQATCTTAK